MTERQLPRPPTAAPVPGDRRSDRRRGDDRRGSLRACAGRRRLDRRCAGKAGAGLLVAALTLLPSLRGAQGGPGKDTLAGEVQPGVPGPDAAGDADDGAPFDGFIEEASALYGVSSDLVRAVIQTESGFDPRAVSGVG